MGTATASRRHQLLVTLACFGLAFAQRPGTVVADTKVNLYVAPARFLSQVVSAWTPTGSVGDVFSGQYGGYLFPMAPFYALGHALGLPLWIVQRLWLGALFAIAALGVLALLRALHAPRRRAAHTAAAAMFVLNPYVVTYGDRTTIALLSYALLPWMLLAIHRGLRDSRGWLWPSVFALLVTASGGGVNAAVTAWVLLGPALLVLYEWRFGGVGRGAVAALLVRLVPLTALASLWWLVGVAVNGAYGLNFLQFTEQPGAIWDTTSVSESLRLMGFWPSYFGIGYGGVHRPFNADAGVMLFNPAVVVASLLVPALALSGLLWTRRRRYAPFFAVLVLAGVVVMAAGFPNGTPLRHGLSFAYYHVVQVQFLRTAYKAGPLVALGLAGLGGMAADELIARLRRVRRPAPARLRRVRRPAPSLAGFGLAGALLAGAALLVALAAWPLARGRLLDAQLQLPHGVPAAWQRAAGQLDRTLPAGQRAMVLPGQLFAFYRWGGTVDPILPALSTRPVAIRTITPYADLRAVDLQWSLDALVSQQRAYPGQLAPLLDLFGVGSVISASDDDRARSGAPPPADAARVLAAQGLATPTHAYGPVRPAQPAAGSLAPPLALAQVRSYSLPTAGLVRVLPRAPLTVLDGDGAGVVGLAAFGALAPQRPLAYAADLAPAQIRAAASAGGEIVITDSNRRRVFVTSSLVANAGPTLGPQDPISVDSAVMNPFAGRGVAAQTVEQLGGGVSYVRAPYSPGFSQFPEHRPFAALDGDPGTAWLADRHLDPARRYLDVGFSGRRDVPYVDLLPYDDSRGTVLAVGIGGRRFAVHPGWNRLLLGLHGVTGLRVSLLSVTHPPRLAGSAGGISELRIPGVHATEALRTPLLAEQALAGASLAHATLDYLFERTTGDDPFQRQPRSGPAGADQVRDAGDGERVLARGFSPPAARSWRADAWVSVAPSTADSALDRLAGYRGPERFDSSSRFQGDPAYRASSAFAPPGARAVRGWIGEWIPGSPAWLALSSPHRLRIGSLRLLPLAGVRYATSVRLVSDAGAGPPLAVAADGRVALPRALSSRNLRIDILAARFAPGTSGFERQRRAVGVARVLGIEGLAPPRIARAGALPRGCGGPLLRVGGSTLRLAVAGTIAALDSGQPLRARGCGAPLALPAGPVVLRGLAGDFNVDLLRLRSAAPAPLPAVGGGGGSGGSSSVLNPGSDGNGSRRGASVRVRGPSWLVLGEGYSRGWRATCDGRQLGAPVPLQGYANAWPLDRSCRRLDFAFAPNALLVDADVASAAGGFLLLVVIALALLGARRGAFRAAPTDLAAPPAARPWPLRAALLAGVLGGAVLGFVFALRAGAVLGPLLFLALWRGVGARTALRTAGLLLVVVVPALYLLQAPPDHGGFNSQYAADLIDAHWAAVLAIVCIAFALGRTLPARGGVRPLVSRASSRNGVRAAASRVRAAQRSRA